MAVYTEIGDDELRDFVALYDIGEVLSCKGIAEGVENSNYLLTTERGNFILTLYEKRVSPADLPFFIALMDHLAHHGVACPTPVRARDGDALRQLCGRPAAIVTFLERHVAAPHRPVPLRRARRRAGRVAPGRRLVRNDARQRSRPAGWHRLYHRVRRAADELRPGMADELAARARRSRRERPATCRAGASTPTCSPTMSSSSAASVGADRLLFRLHRLARLRPRRSASTPGASSRIGSFNVTKARRWSRAIRRRPLSPAERRPCRSSRAAAPCVSCSPGSTMAEQPAGALVQPKDPLEYLRKLRFHRGIASPADYGLDG